MAETETHWVFSGDAYFQPNDALNRKAAELLGEKLLLTTAAELAQVKFFWFFSPIREPKTRKALFISPEGWLTFPALRFSAITSERDEGRYEAVVRVWLNAESNRSDSDPYKEYALHRLTLRLYSVGQYYLIRPGDGLRLMIGTATPPALLSRYLWIRWQPAQDELLAALAALVNTETTVAYLQNMSQAAKTFPEPEARRLLGEIWSVYRTVFKSQKTLEALEKEIKDFFIEPTNKKVVVAEEPPPPLVITSIFERAFTEQYEQRRKRLAELAEEERKRAEDREKPFQTFFTNLADELKKRVLSLFFDDQPAAASAELRRLQTHYAYYQLSLPAKVLLNRAYYGKLPREFDLISYSDNQPFIDLKDIQRSGTVLCYQVAEGDVLVMRAIFRIQLSPERTVEHTTPRLGQDARGFEVFDPQVQKNTDCYAIENTSSAAITRALQASAPTREIRKSPRHNGLYAYFRRTGEASFIRLPPHRCALFGQSPPAVLLPANPLTQALFSECVRLLEFQVEPEIVWRGEAQRLPREIDFQLPEKLNLPPGFGDLRLKYQTRFGELNPNIAAKPDFVLDSRFAAGFYDLAFPDPEARDYFHLRLTVSVEATCKRCNARFDLNRNTACQWHTLAVHEPAALAAARRSPRQLLQEARATQQVRELLRYYSYPQAVVDFFALDRDPDTLYASAPALAFYWSGPEYMRERWRLLAELLSERRILPKLPVIRRFGLNISGTEQLLRYVSLRELEGEFFTAPAFRDQKHLSAITSQPSVEEVYSAEYGVAGNPNLHWGFDMEKQRWRCCDQQRSHPGCWSGVHSAYSVFPDASDLLCDRPQLGSTHLNAKFATPAVQAEIIALYRQERYEDGLRLECVFNQLHGAEWVPQLADAEMDRAFQNYASAPKQQARVLKRANAIGKRFTRFWQHTRIGREDGPQQACFPGGLESFSRTLYILTGAKGLSIQQAGDFTTVMQQRRAAFKSQLVEQFETILKIERFRQAAERWRQLLEFFSQNAVFPSEYELREFVLHEFAALQLTSEQQALLIEEAKRKFQEFKQQQLEKAEVRLDELTERVLRFIEDIELKPVEEVKRLFNEIEGELKQQLAQAFAQSAPGQTYLSALFTEERIPTFKTQSSSVLANLQQLSIPKRWDTVGSELNTVWEDSKEFLFGAQVTKPIRARWSETLLRLFQTPLDDYIVRWRDDVQAALTKLVNDTEEVLRVSFNELSQFVQLSNTPKLKQYLIQVSEAEKPATRYRELYLRIPEEYRPTAIDFLRWAAGLRKLKESLTERIASIRDVILNDEMKSFKDYLKQIGQPDIAKNEWFGVESMKDLLELYDVPAAETDDYRTKFEEMSDLTYSSFLRLLSKLATDVIPTPLPSFYGFYSDLYFLDSGESDETEKLSLGVLKPGLGYTPRGIAAFTEAVIRNVSNLRKSEYKFSRQMLEENVPNALNYLISTKQGDSLLNANWLSLATVEQLTTQSLSEAPSLAEIAREVAAFLFFSRQPCFWVPASASDELFQKYVLRRRAHLAVYTNDIELVEKEQRTRKFPDSELGSLEGYILLDIGVYPLLRELMIFRTMTERYRPNIAQELASLGLPDAVVQEIQSEWRLWRPIWNIEPQVRQALYYLREIAAFRELTERRESELQQIQTLRASQRPVYERLLRFLSET
jgi:hypothetical protein